MKGVAIDYALLKTLHVTCAITSYVLFVVRGVWMLRGSRSRRGRWVKVIPHVVDTALLASAIAMVVVLGQYPFAADWLTAKVLALLIYVVLGMIALKHGRTHRIRVITWIAAQAVFLFIVAVAITRNVVPWTTGT